ncbi:hypothetical protein ACFPOB_21725 [Bosea eneae]|uniref:DUF3828 domain-containing protein n=1 Tax=Bosea eneae TaxID=151454 RepID=A0ABW0IW31_9HYPH
MLAGIGQAAAEATEHFADPRGALGVARGAAAAEVSAALTARTQDCISTEFKPTRCALADNALNADIHYGATHRDRRWAFVSVRWQSDPTGNAVEAKGLVFVAENGSGFRLFGQIDLVGDSVSDVVFEPGRITYATNYLRPDDSRSNPTGRRRYEIPLGANGIGPVAIQRTGFGATSVQSQPQPDGALQLVKRLYEAGEDYAAIFGGSAAASATHSPGLAKVVREAMPLSRRCPIYDGDPRLGGAQGAGGPTRMRYDVEAGRNAVDRRTIMVTAAQAEAPKVVSRTRVVLIPAPGGWRIDDLVTEGMPGYRATLADASARCRSARSR